ncbi:HNH endonuclease [Nonomuraea diastatica]|nr:HNH endonuclease signature motif containing protein [Nonomuraea diastatica]
MVGNSDRNKEWITHRFFRTYDIAEKLSHVAAQPYAFIHDLEDLTIDFGVSEFVPPWQKVTLLHRFASRIAHDMFSEDTSGPYVVRQYLEEPFKVHTKRYLPMDLAMRAYGIDWEPFKVPPPDGEEVEVRPRLWAWRESNKVANACYEYFWETAFLSQAYDDLLSCMADEVFHVVFHNRVLLAGLNSFVADQVAQVDPDDLVEAPEMARFFARNGRLKRVRIPTWVKRAVFFREHGKCAMCGRDLSNLLDVLPSEQFDHVVPLADGGLNDITNIQLLCQKCNIAKSDRAIIPGKRYRRWFFK